MDDLEPLTRAILQARNDIFDEELFHELYREARTLTNRGVRCNSDTIIVPLELYQHILIDVVSIETTGDESLGNLKPDLEFVDVLANALRILLSHAHRQNLRRRSQPPPPITEKPPQRPNYLMLRPIVDYLSHRPASRQVSGFLRNLEAAFQKAKLSLLIDDSGITSGLTNAFDRLLQRPAGVAQALVELLSKAMFHVHTLALPSGKHVTLHIHISTMGVEYRVFEELDGTSTVKIPKESHFQSFNTMKEHIQLIIKLEILSLIESSTEGNTWHMASPFSGELSLDRGFRHRAQVLLVGLADTGLSLTWDGRENTKEKDGKWIWGGAKSPALGRSRGILELARSIAEGFPTEF